MMGGQGQVWVTSALTDGEVRKALVLACSLKRTLSSRRVAVIISPKIEGELRKKLYYVFDLVFTTDAVPNDVTGLKPEDSAKLVALLALKAFEQVAYLSPTMLAVRNVDEIFVKGDGAGAGGDFILPEDGTLRMFLVKPTLDQYDGIMTGLKHYKNGHPTDLCSYLKIWMKNQFNMKMGTVNRKYTQVLAKGRLPLGNEQEISLLDLAEVDPFGRKFNLGEFGMIEKCALKYWQKIYKEDVQPLLEAQPIQRIANLVSNSLPPQYANEPIAIVGMSCRFPGSSNLEEFWNLLASGGDGTNTPPSFRWQREQSCRNRPDCRKTNAGFLPVPVDDFDAKFFGVSPKEILFMDPQHRLLHELVWEGLEDACINVQDLKGTPGSVFIGSWTNDYQDILVNSGNSEFYRMYMGNSIGAAAARISHLLELVGPSVATESGCSSAMVAVHSACRSLQRRESSMALACGVNLLLHPFDQDEMPMVISPDGHCKTFCEKANGFARAEGCGVLVLKRLSDAVRDNDNIWAMIRGSAMTQEGISKSMGTPTVHCESMAMIGALRDAHIGPEQVSYVEAHGTGTVVGDPMEVAAIAKAYHSSLREEPLIIGSVKTNVGHTESCSGITGIIKVALAMHHELIPSHRNFEKLNPAIDLDAVPARIPLEPVEWKGKPDKQRIAGVSSFGITGTDAHFILEESPKNPAEGIWDLRSLDARPLHLVKLSAKTEEALNILLDKYQDSVRSSKESLEDIAYSGNIGRANFPQRAVIIAKSKEELVTNITQRNFLRGEASSDDVGKICFLFTGQGSQYPGMAKKLYETSPVFRMHFDHCEKILREGYSIDIKQALWGTAGQEISRTIYSQTSIFCVEYALLKLWESWGVRPDYALGHSLGEFAAAVCADILKVEDALKLVAERSCLIDRLPGGKMLVIKAPKEQVGNLMQTFGNELDYAAVNSTEQTVVAGDSNVVLEFSKFCSNKGIKSIILEATHAFHSRHMDPMLSDYRKIAATVSKGSGSGCEYISGMRGGIIPATDVGAEYWVQHTREKVSFLEASKQAVELGCTIFIEIGPQPVLSALTMLNNDVNLTCLPSLKKTEQEWVTILNSLGKLYVKGLPIEWEGFDQFLPRNKVRLPSYPFIGKSFWPDLLAVRGATIHPLLGTTIPNASSTKIYQGGINLNTHEYIRDHAIGDNIIVPGAGYLEMCLAAGLATVENAVDSLSKPTRPMKVEDLMIQAPLALKESKTMEVQTVVELNTSSDSTDWNDMSVKIFHRLSGECSSVTWLPHAKATFSPLVSAEEKEIQFDVEEFKRRLQGESNEENLVQIQDKLAAVGLKFGPSFQRLEKVWKTEQDSILLSKVSLPPPTEGQQCDYILHPTVLDAMIQAIMFSRLTSTSIRKKLFVPIKIGKFVWLAGNETEETYIYAYDTQDGSSKKDEMLTASCAALLVDANGKVLAIMSGVELIDTTVKTIEAVLEQQTTSMPDVWEESWRANLGPTQFRLDLPLCNGVPIYKEEFRSDLLQRYNILDEELQSTFETMERLVYCHMLRAMYELGWSPALTNGEFSEKLLAEELGVKREHLQFFGYMLQVLSEEGVLTRGAQPDKWQVVRMPLTLEQITAELNGEKMGDIPVKFLYADLGLNLSQILKGKKSPLQILFPDDPKAQSVGDFYEQYGSQFKVVEVISLVAQVYLKQIKQQTGDRVVIRILEVGGGTGIFTRNLLKLLEELEVEFEYTFTDISPVFFPSAQKMFEKHKNATYFKKLNIEEDPLDQGFRPGYYDYICASDVIHATKDVREALKNIKSLLKPMGKLDVQDQTRVHRPISYLFGLLEGFWRFTDKDLRPSHCTLSEEGWRKVFDSTGFKVAGVFPSVNNYHSYISVLNSVDEKCDLTPSNKTWLILHDESSPVSSFLLKKIPHSTNRQVVVVRRGEKFIASKGVFSVRTNVEEDFLSVMKAMEGRHVEAILYCWSLDTKSVSQEELLRPYFYLVKSIDTLKQSGCPRLLTLTNGVVPLEDSDMSHFSAGTIWGFTKTLRNENVINCRVIDIGGEDQKLEKMMQIFYEIWNEDQDTQVAYNGATRYIPKFQLLKPVNPDLKLPAGTDRFQLVLPETKSIQDLQFGP